MSNKKILTVILNDTSYLPHFGCQLVMENLNNLLKKNNFEVVASFPVKEDWRKNKSIQKKIKTAHCIIVNGEGVIHDGKGEDLVEIANFCKKYNKKVFLINSTYQNNPKSFKKNLIKFDKIYVRESLSKKELENINVLSQVVPDLSLYKNKRFRTNIIKKKYPLGVIDSVNISLSSIKKEVQNARYLPLYIPSQLKYNPSISLWKNIIKNIWSYNFGLLFFVKTKIKCFKGKRELISEINKCEHIFCGRFHGLIMVLMNKSNFSVVKSNSHKIEGLLKDIGIKKKIYENFNELKNININKEKNSKKDKELIENYLNSADSKISTMVKEIKRECMKK